MKTIVTSVRGITEVTDDLVYIGRFVPNRGKLKGWKASPWGNPFKPGTVDNSTALCVLMYASAQYQRSMANSSYLTDLKKELQGKRLGCWCVKRDWHFGMPIAEWCHGIPLAMLADGMDPGEVIESLKAKANLPNFINPAKKDVDVVSALDAVWQAGGSDWEKAKDPDELLREARG
jgi:hypothetical protein